MAKATGPLMSMSASGTIGDTITFDRRGFVRQRVIPANPQTGSQGNVRLVLLATQRALRVIGPTTKAAVKLVAPVAYRWNSFLLQQTIGPNSSEFNSSKVAFAALTAAERANWETAATDIGLTSQAIAYATNQPISPGLALFAVVRALYRLGLAAGQVAGTPEAGNPGDWAQYFTA